MKFDRSAAKLLYELDRNSRVGFSALAKRLKIPEETARYRVNALLRDGIISACYPVIEVGLIGVNIHKLMLRLHKADEQKIEVMSRYLKDSGIVNWAARFDGRFDIGCTLCIHRTRQVTDFIETLRRKFHTHIKEIAHAVNVHAEFFPRDYLVSERRTAPKPASYLLREREAEISIDALDFELINRLSMDARVSVTDLSRKLGIAYETAQKRLNRLESIGIISGYRIVVDHRKTGYLSYYLLLSLNYVSAERMEALLGYLRGHPNVVYLIKMLGQWDYDVSVELPDIEGYRAFMIELNRRFPDVIRESETLITWRVDKFSILPPRVG